MKIPKVDKKVIALQEILRLCPNTEDDRLWTQALAEKIKRIAQAALAEGQPRRSG